MAMPAGKYLPILIGYEIVEKRVIPNVIHDNSCIYVSFLTHAPHYKFSPSVALVRVIVQEVDSVHRFEESRQTCLVSKGAKRPPIVEHLRDKNPNISFRVRETKIWKVAAVKVALSVFCKGAQNSVGTPAGCYARFKSNQRLS